MYIYGIIICLKNSNNELTIKNRTKKLINNLHIQIEIKHPISPTIGCFNSHIKALKKAKDILINNSKIEFIIIGEEDIIIDFESPKYINLIKSLKSYDKNSNYILHIGGFASFTNNINQMINNNNKNLLKARIYLTTGYVVNYNIIIRLLEILENSSRHIHCDSIIANSGIDQYLVKGNLVNQLEVYKSDNTFINNFISTKMQTTILNYLNNYSILFIHNIYLYLLLICYCSYKKKYILSIIETIIMTSSYISKKIIHKKYNKFLCKNIFTYLECVKALRIYTLLTIIS